MAERTAQSSQAGTLRVSVVTPRGPVTDEETDAVTAPGQLGEFEVFPGHVPFLTQLHPGVLVLGEKEGRRVYAVSTGFLEVEPGGVVQVLVEKAVPAAEVDLDAARAEVAELAPQLKDWKGAVDADWKNLKARHDWAQAQVDARARA
ncbi:MAG TPA: ATP synthase F1 subunit epsilon [Kofleriaceae bacterium]|nr:ATP synthase F1 subunit epsilon [Kofleriaceae bacterium]